MLILRPREDNPDHPNWLTYEAAAKFLDVSVSTIKRYVAKGWIKAAHYSRKKARISREHLEETRKLLNQRREPGERVLTLKDFFDKIK